MRKYTKLNIRNRKNPVQKKAKPAKLKLKKGDKVIVVSGKDKGKQGVIERAYPATGKILVEGIAIAKRHVGRRRGQSSHVVEVPRPIDASNVMLVDPKDGKPTRVGRAGGARTAKKSGTKLS